MADEIVSFSSKRYTLQEQADLKSFLTLNYVDRNYTEEMWPLVWLTITSWYVRLRYLHWFNRLTLLRYHYCISLSV